MLVHIVHMVGGCLNHSTTLNCPIWALQQMSLMHFKVLDVEHIFWGDWTANFIYVKSSWSQIVACAYLFSLRTAVDYNLYNYYCSFSSCSVLSCCKLWKLWWPVVWPGWACLVYFMYSVYKVSLYILWLQTTDYNA